jgi:hypothetical protein
MTADWERQLVLDEQTAIVVPWGYLPTGRGFRDYNLCDHENCGERARWIVDFTVNRVFVRALVCTKHRASLPLDD